jgi:hypothetical protein
MLAYHPDAAIALLRLKTDCTLWRERRWRDLGDREATLLDVSDQLPAVFAAFDPADADPTLTEHHALAMRFQDRRLAFRIADRRLVVVPEPLPAGTVPVNAHGDLSVALAIWHAGGTPAGCRR